MKKNLSIIILLIACVTSLALAYYQKQETETYKLAALENRMLAEEQRVIAEQQRRIAEEQKFMAEANAREAQKQTMVAMSNLEMARQAEKRSLINEQKARENQLRAEQAMHVAILRQREAERSAAKSQEKEAVKN